MSLAICLATRGRPQLLCNTIMQTLGKIARPDTVFMIAADADDHATVDMLETLKERGVPIAVSVEQREDTIAAKWNRVLKAYPDAGVYMPMCDDRPVATSGFDERILKAAARFPDGIGVVFNHLDNLSFTSIQAVTSRLTKLMGGVIYVEAFPYWFVDHWLSDVAEMVDRIVFADVRLDETARPPTQEMREPGWWATFYDACKLRRHAVARHILAAAIAAPDGTPGWMAEMLISRWPLIDEYSKIINDSVRGMRVPEAPQDERYQRVKRRAQDLLREVLVPELEKAA